MGRVAPRAGLDALYARLAKHRVWSWFSDYGREASAETPVDAPDKADAVSSLLTDDPVRDQFVGGRHLVLLDVDHPVTVVDSTTPGHHHLIIDVPGGVPEAAYLDLLDALAAAGVVEEGYAGAARRRGYTSVRPYWARKGRPILRCVECLERPEDLDEYRQMAWSERPARAARPDELHAQEIIDWTWSNEGTINKMTGGFWCTSCYVKVGMPIGVPPEDPRPKTEKAPPPVLAADINPPL